MHFWSLKLEQFRIMFGAGPVILILLVISLIIFWIQLGNIASKQSGNISPDMQISDQCWSQSDQADEWPRWHFQSVCLKILNFPPSYPMILYSIMSIHLDRITSLPCSSCTFRLSPCSECCNRLQVNLRTSFLYQNSQNLSHDPVTHAPARINLLLCWQYKIPANFTDHPMLAHAH